ncbi:MAG: DUF2254 domain-containing protein [Gemmatimonadota bacterium]
MGRFRQLIAGFRESLGFLPSLLTLAAILFAALTIAVDLALMGEYDPDGAPLLFSAGAEGARGVLGAIAGGIITVTGVIFSVTIVALQLASTQFTPRVLRNFTADRGNQLTLGVLIASFTYTLLVLRTIRADAARGAFVPVISVTVSLMLALVSIAFLIYFIAHLARSLQAVVIIQRVADETLKAVGRTFVPPGDAASRRLGPGGGHTGGRAPVRARDTGYIRTIDTEAMLTCAAEMEATIRIELEHGRFVLPGSVLISVWPAARLRGEYADRLRNAVTLGWRRTIEEDPAWGVIELADIAVRALSSGVADPTTASLCVDRLSEILVEIGRREPRYRLATRPGEHGVGLRPLTFDHIIGVAFDRIAIYGASDVTVVRHLLDALAAVARRVPVHRRTCIARQIELLRQRAERVAAVEADRSTIRVAAAAALGDARSETPALAPPFSGRAAPASSP